MCRCVYSLLVIQFWLDNWHDENPTQAFPKYNMQHSKCDVSLSFSVHNKIRLCNKIFAVLKRNCDCMLLYNKERVVMEGVMLGSQPRLIKGWRLRTENDRVVETGREIERNKDRLNATTCAREMMQR